MRWLYSLIILLITPLFFLYLGFRGFSDRRYWKRWGERLGWSNKHKVRADILLHAASMGEVNAAAPLIEALLDKHPGLKIFLTTITPTGSQRVSELFGQRVSHAYLPLDLAGTMRRLIRKCSPSVVVIIETEIWPNLYHHSHAAAVPLIIANARLTQKSVSGYQRARAIITPALSGVHRVLAQSDEDARRFVHCGAAAENVVVAGNLKFDVTIPASVLENAELLKTSWTVTRPVLVAGSTHEADEKALVKAFSSLLERHTEALLIIAPRHPERFKAAADLVQSAGLETTLLSVSRLVPPSAQCLVIDTMGELLNFYAAADVTFVGGTIANIGGHNIIEPAALGKPVLVGPHTRNLKAVAQQLGQAGAVIQLKDPAELESVIDKLFSDAAARDAMGQAGLALVEEGRGAVDRTVDLIERELNNHRVRP